MQELVEDGTRSVLFSTHLTEDLDRISDYVALLDRGQMYFCMDKENLRERYVLLKGSEQEILALDSPNIIAAVHEPFGSTALVEYPDETLPAGLESSRPSLAELLFYLRKGGRIS